MSNIDNTFSTLDGMKIAVAEWGLVRGYCALVKGEDAWCFCLMKDLQKEMKRFPQADTILFYEGDLAALRDQFKLAAA